MRNNSINEYPVAVILARLDSKRFPSKVTKKVKGQEIISRIIKRIKLCNFISEIYLTIPSSKTNDGLVHYAEQNQINLFRGSPENVLKRVSDLCKKIKCKSIVRINGDCPFIDPFLIDKLVEIHIEDDNDYTSNILEDSFITGMHIEVINASSLFKAANEAKLDIDKEHVTPYIYNRPDIFNIKSIKSKKDNSYLRLCIDYPEDLEMIDLLIEKTNDQILSESQLVDLINNNHILARLCKRFNKKQSIRYKYN